jgi:hypothetical protein
LISDNVYATTSRKNSAALNAWGYIITIRLILENELDVINFTSNRRVKPQPLGMQSFLQYMLDLIPDEYKCSSRLTTADSPNTSPYVARIRLSALVSLARIAK